jgi:hypothetical protein
MTDAARTAARSRLAAAHQEVQQAIADLVDANGGPGRKTRRDYQRATSSTPGVAGRIAAAIVAAAMLVVFVLAAAYVIGRLWQATVAVWTG